MTENRKIEVQIRSLPFHPRKGGEYRAGSIQVLDAAEALELVEAGVASIVTDPFLAPEEPGIPYLQPETPQAESDGDKDSDEESDAESDSENAPETSGDESKGAEDAPAGDESEGEGDLEDLNDEEEV